MSYCSGIILLYQLHEIFRMPQTNLRRYYLAFVREIFPPQVVSQICELQYLLRQIEKERDLTRPLAILLAGSIEIHVARHVSRSMLLALMCGLLTDDPNTLPPLYT